MLLEKNGLLQWMSRIDRYSKPRRSSHIVFLRFLLRLKLKICLKSFWRFVSFQAFTNLEDKLISLDFEIVKKWNENDTYNFFLCSLSYFALTPCIYDGFIIYTGIFSSERSVRFYVYFFTFYKYLHILNIQNIHEHFLLAINEFMVVSFFLKKIFQYKNSFYFQSYLRQFINTLH